MVRTVFGVILLVWIAGCQASRPPALVYVSGGVHQIEPDSQVKKALINDAEGGYCDPCLDNNRSRVVFITAGRSNGAVLGVLTLQENGTRSVGSPLHSTQGRMFSPVWSNDGDRIAFTEEVGGRLIVKVINADGTGLAEIGYGCEPSWRQDDRAIFFSSRDKLDAESGDLTVHDLKTGLNKSLALRGNGFSNLPRGTSVLYTTLPYSRRNEAVWILDANGKTRRLSEPNKDFRDVDPVHIGGTALVAFTRINVKTGKAAIYVVDRQSDDPIAVPLVEGKDDAYTRGGELLIKD